MDLHSIFRALSDDLDICSKDKSYLLSRLQSEGFRFVTVTLPAYSKHILECVENGVWTDFYHKGGCPFSTNRKGLPVFLQGFLLQLFSKTSRNHSWLVRKDADPVSLLQIRQLCEYAYKLCLPVDKSVLAQAAETFESNDKEVRGIDSENSQHVDRMRRNFLGYYPVANSINMAMCALAAHPGPGTFSGKRSWEAQNKRKYFHRNYVTKVIPASLIDYAYAFRFNKRSPRIQGDDKGPSYSEVLFVPKDSRGPRTIVREPYQQLEFQMGFNSLMSSALEQDTSRRVNFGDQTINQRLAHTSSIDKKMSTLDLKDASDMVSYHVVRRLFEHIPLGAVLSKLRTRKCLLPSGKEIYLNKLAGMGSGFTFPCMSLVIHLTICTYISRRTGTPYRECMRSVYVYGDDIVLPTSWFRHAIIALQLVGLRVNTMKSFCKSFFRESCGGDYFHGNAVSPTLLRLSGADFLLERDLSFSLRAKARDPKENLASFILGCERHARELSLAQLYKTAELYENNVERMLTDYFGNGQQFRLPIVTSDSPVFGRLRSRTTVLDSLEFNAVGNAKTARYVVPVGMSDSISDACPYQHLRSRFKVESAAKWTDNIFPVGKSAVFGVLTKPRTVKLLQRRMSSYSLT